MIKYAPFVLTVLLSLSPILSAISCFDATKTVASVLKSEEQQISIWINKIENQIQLELSSMESMIINKTTDQIIRTESMKKVDLILEVVQSQLETIKSKISNGVIKPWTPIVTAYGMESSKKSDLNRPARVGYFPVSADPFHWAHLLIPLEVMAKHDLDKVVFIVQGKDDRKKGMSAPEVRHPIAKKTIDTLFKGLFEMSDITTLQGTNSINDIKKLSSNGPNDGETNMFHDLFRNKNIEIDAYYIVGADHLHYKVDGKSDTGHKLHENRSKPNLRFSKKHNVSAVFLGRDPKDITDQKVNDLRNLVDYPVLTLIPALSGFSSSISSTNIRKFFKSGDEMAVGELIAIPETTYRGVIDQKMYQGE